jgi:NAD(P)-dependent dehydrogenase (short-subunit alcohol dehydrogenase family)
MPSRSRMVLLTGAAGGIGRVMTRALLRGGHCVAAVDRDAESLERLKSLCDSERLSPIVADLSTETGCAHAIEIARERFGTIEALVNNAGIGMSA